MAKINLREKVKNLLPIKKSKKDLWTLEDAEAWKQFCFKTPGLLHLAKKMPSEATIDEASKKRIEELLVKAEKKKSSNEIQKEEISNINTNQKKKEKKESKVITKA